MRNLKRLLTMVMAIAMLMSLMVVGAGATSFNDDKDITHKDAVQKMVSLNIINGRDGNFDPNGIVTRAEMAKMICVALSGGNDPKLSPNTVVSFTDTKDHWAAGYIEYCVNMGIIAGLGNNVFGPDQKVTPTQAAKMLLVALGYDAAYEKFTGPTWALATNKIAQGSKDLYDDIQGIDPNAPMTRDAAAQMVYNFCYATMVEYEFGISGTGGSVVGVKQAKDIKDQTILSKYYKLESVKGTLTKISYDNSKKEYGYEITLANGSATTYYTSVDFSALFGMKVELMYKDKGSAGYNRTDDTIYDVAADGSKLIAEGYTGDFSSSGYSAANKEIKFNGVKYDVDNASVASVYFVDGNNGTAYAGTASVLVPAGAECSKVRLLDVDNNNKVDKIVVIPFSVEKVTYVGSDNVTVTGTTANKKLADITSYTDIAKDDQVAVFAAKYSTTDKVTFEKATIGNGKITSTRTSDFKIGDSWYSNGVGQTTSIALGDTIDFVAFGGEFFYAKVKEVGATSKDVAIVVNVGQTTGADSGKPEATILKADGTKKTAVVTKMNGADAVYGGMAKNAFTPGATTAGNMNVEDRVGQLVTFVVDKDGKLELTDVSTTNKAGYDGLGDNTAFDDSEETVGGKVLADDATVFVIDYDTTKNDATGVNTAVSGNDAKVYTGKEIKNGLTSDYGTAFDTSAIPAALYKEYNGFNKAGVATINANVFPTINSGANYGYLVEKTDRTYNEKESKYYLTYSIWNGKEVLTVNEEESSTAKQATMVEGAIVSYDNAGNGLVKNVTLAPVATAAIKGWNDAKTTGDISFVTGTNELAEINAKIDSDTTVLFVDSDKKDGIPNGQIQKASDRTGDGKINIYDANARYLLIGNNVDVIVVDPSATFKPLDSITVTSVADDATLVNLLATYEDVTINGNYTTAQNSTVLIPAGNTLTVTGTLTVDTGTTLDVNGALNAGTITMNGTSVIDFATAPNATLMGKLEASATNNTTVIFAAASASVAANKWYTSIGTADPTAGDASATLGTAAATIAAGATVPAGTYKYTTNFGFDGTEGNTAANVSGWIKQP